MNNQIAVQHRFGKKAVIIGALIIIVFGIAAFFAINMFMPASSNQTPAVPASIANGVQNLTTPVTAGKYPNITVQKGVPVVWDMKADTSVLSSCSDSLVISEYGIKLNLKSGDNVIKFTPNKSGMIQYSCEMGMVTGHINVVDNLISERDKTPVAATVENEVQNITTVLASQAYPNITFQKDIPVVWNIKADPSVLTSCNSVVEIPEYGLKINLKAGDNIIKFTPTEDKIIKYTCHMNMVTGQINVVKDLKA